MAQLSRADQASVAAYLREHLPGPLSLEVWTRKESALLRTDRDPCTHCDDTLELAREIASLHPGISLTLYDLERHASRAAEAGIGRAPTTVVRARGRQLRFVGFWAGALLAPFVDSTIFAAAGVAPLEDSTRRLLGEVGADVELEVLAASYDPYSAQLASIAFAFAVESRRVHAEVVEIAEFPLLAATRGVTEVPVLFANGQRYVGSWPPDALAEQLRRIAAGDQSPVIRERVPVSSYLTEEQALAAAGGGPPEQRSPGGLVLPGQ